MSFDLFQSRRTYNELCKWWARDERDQHDLDELVMRRIPSGEFYAKEVNPEQLQKTVIGAAFVFDKTTVTIKTPDNIMKLKNNDLVLYRGAKWLVVDVQRRHAHEQQSEFARDSECSHYYYINLRK